MSQIDRRAFIAAAGAAAAVPFSAGAGVPATGWTSKAPLPWAVQEIYCAVADGRIVVAGGLRRATGPGLIIEDRVGVYDPAGDVWSEAARLPSPRHHPMVFTGPWVGFAVGGYGRGEAGDWTNMTDGWILTASGWEPAYPLPAPQAEAVGLQFGDNLHLITGRTPGGSANAQWNDQVDTAEHRVLVPGGRGWERGRPAPMARNSAAGAVLDGAIWIAGGRTVGGGGTGRLDRYDPVADRWDTLAPIPPSPATGQQVGGGLAMAAAGGRLVAFGGEWFAPGGGGVFAETWLYDPAADRWEAGPPMRTPRHGLAAAVVDGVVYAIAGGEVVSGGRAGGVVEALAG
jgi:N-acetylneuraminic acid mutarotase